MNRILLIILTTLILALIFYFVVISFLPRKAKKEQLPPIQVAPSFSPSPKQPQYRQFMPLPTPADLKPLKVIKAEPPEDLSIDHNPVTQIRFTFTDDVSVDNFLLEISPDTKIEITPRTSTHTYTISAIDFWPTGINTFTIKKDTKSQSGSTLEETFVYKINIQYPKNPPPDEDI